MRLLVWRIDRSRVLLFEGVEDGDTKSVEEEVVVVAGAGLRAAVLGAGFVFEEDEMFVAQALAADLTGCRGLNP